MRLITKCSPSTASSRPARQPRNVERNSRRPIRHSISTDSVPSSATMKRQPNGSKPNSFSPTPITHLPIGGWTTYPGSVGTRTAPGSVRIVLSMSFGQAPSYPWLIRAQESLA